MNESLFSAQWYRVAGVRPRLRSHAVIHRHSYRGQLWYVLQDRASGRFHRFSPGAHLVIGLMDGERTLADIWQAAATRLGDDAPTQDEVIQILATLHRADVLQTDAPPDLEELHERHGKQRRIKLKQYVLNPLALRVPLVDPERFLAALQPLARWLFGRWGALLWLLVVGYAAVLAGSHWRELSANVTERVLSVDNLLLMGLAFPLAKLVHEFGHGLAVKARGGEVHEMGVMLLVLMPVPYVDASASLALRDKWQRVQVGAAGMLAELFLASLAMMVWVAVEPGLVRALAYNVMVIAGISTVIFNINPLLRFDGYYMLADAIEIPNLGQRANAYLAYLVRRRAFGVRNLTAPPTAPGERPWFVAFSMASFLYRMVVMAAIALLVAERYFFFGVLLAAWALYSMLLQPLAQRLGYLFGSRELYGRRARALTLTAGVLGGLLSVLMLWPAPSWTLTEGVAVVPQHAQVRAGSEGFVKRVVARQNQAVRPGDVLLHLEDPELPARVQVLQAEQREQLARYAAAVGDRVQQSLVREELAHVEARLANARAKLQDLVVRSPAEGRFVMPDLSDVPGRFVRRGDVLAYAVDQSRLAIQVVVPQSEVDLVRQATRRVELLAVERLDQPLPAHVKRVVPAATQQLPGMALGAQGGGTVTLDPGADGQRPGEARAAHPMFVFELELEGPPRMLSLGSRIYVRFEREPEPLAQQWWRAWRGLLLQRFEV